MVACIWAATACQHPGSAGCLEARALCEILSGTAHALGYKAIAGGARTIDEVRRRTRAATGPCGATRCGPVIREMLRGR